MTRPVKHHERCGRSFTRAQWNALDDIGGGYIAGELQHHKRCPCGSTIVRRWCEQCGRETTMWACECGEVRT